MKEINVCPKCGGELQFIKINDNYKCGHCGSLFEEERVANINDELNKLFDAIKQEKIANLRQRLYEAINEKYQSKDKIVSISREIRNYLPNDTMATFFEKLNTNINDINDYLNNININDNYYLLDLIIENMIKSMEVINILTLNNFIEKAYKDNDLSLYNKYSTLLSKEAEKLENGIYELNIPRDVFIAYSSKDMKYVEDLVKALDENGITSFVAMKNLRHGQGAVENYDKALETAIDNSKIFIFISSNNSRNLGCDALKKEIPYLKKKDIDNAPSEYKNNYSIMPLKYKKPRIQYVLTKPKNTAIDRIVDEVFDGYEWRYDINSVIDNIVNILMNNNVEEIIEEPKKEIKQEPKPQKFTSTVKTSKNVITREGNTITFGSYYINDDKTKEPLKWDILDEEDDKILIITHEVIDSKCFDVETNDYEKSSIRKWLNKNFYNTAFTAEEKKHINLTLVDNSLSSFGKVESKKAYNNTEDNIFLLSIKENKMYYSEYNKKPQGTPYAKNKGLWNEVFEGGWWLRSAYNDNNSIYCAGYEDAGFDEETQGSNVDENNIGIRPACWISMNEIKKETNTVKKEHVVSTNPTNTIKKINMDSPKSIITKEGNTIIIGSYYNKDDKTKEPLKWDILEEKDGKALIITHDIIDAKPFLPKNMYESRKIKTGLFKKEEMFFNISKGVPYETYANDYEYSYIRKWLNEDFYNIAFNAEEKKSIQLTLVDNSLLSTGDKTNGYICNNTNDNIFLLSKKEVETYYKTGESRRANGTEFAKKQGLYIYDNKADSYWWLRSPFDNYSYSVYFVVNDGVNDLVDGHIVNDSHSGVRPACWIKLK